jgi:protein involved in polysaccharide export with SLBB domain
MTLEGPDGKRYLVYRDGSLALPGNGPVRMADLTPGSRAIIAAILRGRENATEAAAVGEPDRAQRSDPA